MKIISTYLLIWVFTNGLGDLRNVIRKTLQIELDTSLLITQQYNIRIKGKVEQSKEKSCALLYTSV